MPTMNGLRTKQEVYQACVIDLPHFFSLHERIMACIVQPHSGNFTFRGELMKATNLVWGGGRRRSWKREALMIGATAGIATAVGAMIGKKKGAAFGAISGGVSRFLSRW